MFWNLWVILSSLRGRSEATVVRYTGSMFKVTAIRSNQCVYCLQSGIEFEPFISIFFICLV